MRLVTPGTKPRHIPLGVLGLVVVHGRALVGCDVWRALAERGIPAVMQPGRGRGVCAWMGPALGATGVLRAAQHRAAEQVERRLMLARDLIAAKLLDPGYWPLIWAENRDVCRLDARCLQVATGSNSQSDRGRVMGDYPENSKCAVLVTEPRSF